jgi:hypothetical protein
MDGIRSATQAMLETGEEMIMHWRAPRPPLPLPSRGMDSGSVYSSIAGRIRDARAATPRFLVPAPPFLRETGGETPTGYILNKNRS